MDLRPVVLEGTHVRLEPLERGHLPALCAIGLDPAIWRWTLAVVRAPDDMGAYLDEALAMRDSGTALPFAIVERESERLVGSTRFANADHAHRRVEVGWSWLAPNWQRTACNTEAKLLLLSHAFERLDCHRVEFKTDALNAPSRAALRRIGAREEGTLRGHMQVQGGRVRDSVYFSILAPEWPEIRDGLLRRLGRA